MKKVFCIFTIVLIIVSGTCCFYANSIVTIGLDEGLMNSYLAEDESNVSAVKDAVNNFVYNYITAEMSDFEKEMQIIKYLVATCTYDLDELYDDSAILNDSYKAYGALVNHKAVCSGYAKACDLLAKKCGLSTIIVTGEAINSENQNGPHAWNQIYLDGEWYNVDVTWEDPATNVEVGFNQLFNNYINRTDAEFEVNHIRSNGNYCSATKYGKNTVAYYLNTGLVDVNANIDALRKYYEAQIGEFAKIGNDTEMKAAVDKLIMLGAKYDDNTNFIISNSDLEITNYILSQIASGKNIITIVTGPNTQNAFSIDKGDWMEKNLHYNGHCTMNRIFASDGKFDTRILIFNFS